MLSQLQMSCNIECDGYIITDKDLERSDGGLHLILPEDNEKNYDKPQSIKKLT
jgi:hypothetical protein